MTSARISLARLVNRPDLLLACGGVLYGLYQASRILPARPLHPVVLAILTASFTYLALHKRIGTQTPASRHCALAARLASDIIFAIACGIAVLAWHRSLYVLPPVHYVALVAAAGTVVWDVASVREGRSDTAVMLTKVIILGLLVRGAAYSQFPGPIGSDPWRHSLTAQVLTETGRIPTELPDALGTENAYTAIPVFHILSACASQVAGVSAKAALFLAGSLPLVLSSVVIFLIGRSLHSPHAGVLAATLYCLSDYAILWGVQVIAMTLASVLGAFVLWLVLSGRPASGASVVLALLFMLTLVWCHTVSAFVVFAGLAAALVGLRVFRMLWRLRVAPGMTPLLTPSVVALCGTLMLVWWMTLPTSTGDSFFAVQTAKLAQVLATSSESQGPSSVSVAPLSFMSSLHQSAGGALLIGLGLFAVLSSLKLVRSSGRCLVLSIAVSALLTIQAVGSSSLQEALIGARWIIFQYMFLASLAAWVLVSVLTHVSRPLPHLAIAAVLSVVYVFPMVTNAVASPSSSFGVAPTARLGYTESEQTAWRTMVSRLKVNPVSDGYYIGAMATATSAADYGVLSTSNTELLIERGNYLAKPELNEVHLSVIGDIRDVSLGFYRLEGQSVFITGYAAELALTGGVVYANDTTRMVQLTP